jgi:hypothetical protein
MLTSGHHRRRSTAQASSKAYAASCEGSYPMYACEAKNNGFPSVLLARPFFPDADINQLHAGSESLVSFHHAARLIGFIQGDRFCQWINAAGAA